MLKLVLAALICGALFAAGAARAEDMNARLEALQNGAPSTGNINDAGANTLGTSVTCYSWVAGCPGHTAYAREELDAVKEKGRVVERALADRQRAAEREATFRRIEQIVNPCPMGGTRVNSTTCVVGQ